VNYGSDDSKRFLNIIFDSCFSDFHLLSAWRKSSPAHPSHAFNFIVESVYFLSLFPGIRFKFSPLIGITGSHLFHFKTCDSLHLKHESPHSKGPIEMKKSLFESLEGLSTRETEKELIQQDPQFFEGANKRESLRQITPDFQELKLILTAEMQRDLEKLKLLLSHSMPGASLTEVLNFAVKESIQKRDLQRIVKSTKRRQETVIETESSGKIERERKAQPALVVANDLVIQKQNGL